MEVELVSVLVQKDPQGAGLPAWTVEWVVWGTGSPRCPRLTAPSTKQAMGALPLHREETVNMD